MCAIIGGALLVGTENVDGITAATAVSCVHKVCHELQRGLFRRDFDASEIVLLSNLVQKLLQVEEEELPNWPPVQMECASMEEFLRPPQSESSLGLPVILGFPMEQQLLLKPVLLLYRQS
jgi:hypothetical protein